MVFESEKIKKRLKSCYVSLHTIYDVDIIILNNKKTVNICSMFSYFVVKTNIDMFIKNITNHLTLIKN